MYDSMIAVHKDMLDKYTPRVLVYNGDVDPGCNYLCEKPATSFSTLIDATTPPAPCRSDGAACHLSRWAEASVAKFGKPLDDDWHPWVYGEASIVGEQLGGFVTDYKDDVHFATVHGAGHMSPQWRPEAVFYMLQRFLGGKSL